MEGYYLSFNPVGAQGIEQVNTSNSDVLYTEFWPWDQDRDGALYDTYQALVTEVERTMEESRPCSIDGKGKSLVVKAYINYYKTTGTMNAPGVFSILASILTSLMSTRFWMSSLRPLSRILRCFLRLR